MIYNYVIYMYINILLLSACDAGSMVTSICWNDGANMLAAMQDGNFVVWYHPGIVHLDRDLLPITVLTKEGRYMYIYTDSLLFGYINCRRERHISLHNSHVLGGFSVVIE